MQANARCSRCHQPIRWVTAAATNSRIDIDPEGVRDGNIWPTRWVGEETIVDIALSADDVPRWVPTRYVAHSVTCTGKMPTER